MLQLCNIFQLNSPFLPKEFAKWLRVWFNRYNFPQGGWPGHLERDESHTKDRSPMFNFGEFLNEKNPTRYGSVGSFWRSIRTIFSNFVWRC
jgi:hypothetical protein